MWQNSPAAMSKKFVKIIPPDRHFRGRKERGRKGGRMMVPRRWRIGIRVEKRLGSLLPVSPVSSVVSYSFSTKCSHSPCTVLRLSRQLRWVCWSWPSQVHPHSTWTSFLLFLTLTHSRLVPTPLSSGELNEFKQRWVTSVRVNEVQSRRSKRGPLP